MKPDYPFIYTDGYKSGVTPKSMGLHRYETGASERRIMPDVSATADLQLRRNLTHGPDPSVNGCHCITS